MRRQGEEWSGNKNLTVMRGIAPLIFILLLFPSCSAAIISINDVFMVSNGTAAADIMINNVSNLGVADINLTFDPSVIHIVSATNSDFDFFHAVIDNSTGIVRMGGIDFGDGLNGDVKLAEIMLEAVGEHGEVSELNLSINELKEAGAVERSIPATVSNGSAYLNIPPVAVAESVHRYNNVGDVYPCKALFDASASYDTDGDAIINHTWDFGDGYFGEGLTVEHVYSSYKWNGTGYEPFNVSLTVKDEWGLTNTTSLQVSVYIAGDANGDGVVDIFDAVIVGLEWDSACTSGRWESERADRADLNNDCIVDIFDAVIVGANWEHTAW